jgi:hypothetical protein
MALALVVGITSVLFILATALLQLVVYQTAFAAADVARAQALHIADAGVNAYLYELRWDPDYYVTTPTLTAATAEGTWRVVATPPSTQQPYLTLRSTGTLASGEATRVVAATVRFPTFADYMFLEDCDISIGSGAIVNGKVHSNHNVSNSGRITGVGSAYGQFTNSGSGVTEQGYLSGPSQVSEIPFSQLKSDMDAMKTAGQLSGARGYSAPAASGKQGYEVVLNGTSYTRRSVSGSTGGGYSVSSDAVTLAIPNSGILFFDDDIWVKGTYGLSITIVSSANIYVVGDFVPVDPHSNTTAGMIAELNVSVPGQYSVIPNNMTIQAALLAKTGSVTSTYGSTRKASLTMNGSLADAQVGAFAGAFSKRTYTYDQRLDLFPPPMYPVVRTDAMKVQSWVER